MLILATVNLRCFLISSISFSLIYPKQIKLNKAYYLVASEANYVRLSALILAAYSSTFSGTDSACKANPKT